MLNAQSIIEHVLAGAGFASAGSTLRRNRKMRRPRGGANGDAVIWDHVASAGIGFACAMAVKMAQAHDDVSNAPPCVWVVAPHLRAQERVYDELLTWGVNDVNFLPDLPMTSTKTARKGESANEIIAPAVSAEVIRALVSLAQHRSKYLGVGSGIRREPRVVVLTKQAWQMPVPEQGHATQQGIIFRVGDIRDPQGLLEQWSAAGFEPVPQVVERGQCSLRGGILDVFSLHGNLPVRLEFFGDDIESIREFDIDTQVSVRHLNEASIVLYEQEFNQYLLDWIDPRDVVINLPLAEDGNDVAADVYLAHDPATDWSQLNDDGTEDYSTAIFDHPLGIFDAGDFMLHEPRRNEALQQMRTWRRQGWRVVVFFPNDGEKERFAEIVRAADIMPHIDCVQGALPFGFIIPGCQVAVLSGSELFGRFQPTSRRLHDMTTRTSRAATAQEELKTINPGDLVVHTSYGIGKFIRIAKGTDVQGVTGDEEMQILYANNVVLHVPLIQSYLVNRYIGMGSKAPQLSKLNDARWQRTKQSAQRAAVDYAAQLLSVQAGRKVALGYAHPPDSRWVHDFESSFPFQETPDQMRAILAVKNDMESPHPMERLICGDVGFGKTEVALRAAFKCVCSGRQVAMLVPTTVLAEQHWHTFKSRMSEYPIRVEMLSRFNSTAETRTTLEGIASGAVDVVIGTHKLIFQAGLFKNLGLVVIDEEQRFGVKHKEEFKKLFAGVDLLVLSATPIPRTLYMALMGARDMSTIETPPVNRIPVQTSVAPYDERIIKRAIEYELARGGQVFFLHNRVKTIDLMSAKIQKLVPSANLVIGHGQMDKNELEKVMRQFVHGKSDVLLSTTIIESGIDIPNANTIIIDRADQFGLADLYQLRGRVGRADHAAYAYLMLPRGALTTGDARRRVSAIKQYSALGSGFKIAMRDLEIRGAGNLLGTQQSGHIAAIGFDLYCQLLEQSVRHSQGKPATVRGDAQVLFDKAQMSEARWTELTPEEKKCYVPIFLPADYVQDAGMRIAAYKSLANATSPDELDALLLSWSDRFGKIPPTVLNLICLQKIKLLSSRVRISLVEIEGQKLKLTRNGEFILLDSKFPRLKSANPHKILQEVVKLLDSI